MKYEITAAKVSKTQFESDLETCLDIIQYLGVNGPYTYYKCRYVTPALYVREVFVAVFEG